MVGVWEGVKATTENEEGDWVQTGSKKREKNVKSVTNAGTLISRVGAANVKAVYLQIPVHRGLDLNKHVQTTSQTVASKKDTYLDLTGIHLSPKSITNTDTTLIVEENTDRGLDPSDVIFPHL